DHRNDAAEDGQENRYFKDGRGGEVQSGGQVNIAEVVVLQKAAAGKQRQNGIDERQHQPDTDQQFRPLFSQAHAAVAKDLIEQNNTDAANDACRKSVSRRASGVKQLRQRDDGRQRQQHGRRQPRERRRNLAEVGRYLIGLLPLLAVRQEQ